MRCGGSWSNRNGKIILRIAQFRMSAIGRFNIRQQWLKLGRNTVTDLSMCACLHAWDCPKNLEIVQASVTSHKKWCRLRDSNSRPDDYKSTALPTELSRHSFFALTLRCIRADFPPYRIGAAGRWRLSFRMRRMSSPLFVQFHPSDRWASSVQDRAPLRVARPRSGGHRMRGPI